MSGFSGRSGQDLSSRFWSARAARARPTGENRRMSSSRPDGNLRPVWQVLSPAVAVVVLAGLELAARAVARTSILHIVFGTDFSATLLVACSIAATLVSLALLRVKKRLTTTATVVMILICAFPAGVAAQLHLGARLQSDGFYYYAYLRSLWFDGDVDLTNDYRMLGQGDKAHLFTLTPTGAAQSTWSVGPAIV